ncbi:MAG TPA: biotin synthase BioB, partial [Nitrospirota bacterium]|nr:biotin synthase BioB [Nitrospirota bacterium]
NILMPIPGTPLGDAEPILPLDALGTIALFRFVLPGTEIRVCGGRVTALRDLHPMIFGAGANGLLMGDYLTTAGRDYQDDIMMLADLGLHISYE